MKDPLGLVPKHIREIHERQEFVDRGARVGRELDQALKAVDSRLSCVFIRPDIREADLPGEAIAGRWHVRRHNDPPALPTYLPIVGPNGTYADPEVQVDRIIRQLAERDLRRKGVTARMMELGRADSQKKTHAKELEAEQRRDEIKHNFEAAKRVAGEGGLHKSFAKKRSPGRKAA